MPEDISPCLRVCVVQISRRYPDDVAIFVVGGFNGKCKRAIAEMVYIPPARRSRKQWTWVFSERMQKQVVNNLTDAEKEYLRKANC